MSGKKKQYMGPSLFIDGTKFEKEAMPLYPIMIKSIGPLFHQMTIAELLFASYLAGINHIIKAEDKIQCS